MTRSEVIAVFTKNRTNPAYAAARLGADRSAQRMGARALHYVPHKDDDPQEQIALIDAALAARPDAFVLVPVHPMAINAAIRKITAAGVPIVGFINRFSEPSTVSFVSSDDYPLAFRVATYLCAHLKGRGEVVIFEGPRESVTSLARVRGFHDALAKFPAVRVAASVSGDYLHEPTLRAGRQLLQQRAFTKYHCGGLWTNACCSHQMAGESSAAAAKRRLFQQLRLRTQLTPLARVRYRARVGHLIEHECVDVFVGLVEDMPRINPAEAARVAWLSPGDPHLHDPLTPWSALYLDLFGFDGPRARALGLDDGQVHDCGPTVRL